MLNFATDSIDNPIAIAALDISDLLFIELSLKESMCCLDESVNSVFSFFMIAPCWYVYIMGMYGYYYK
jgi:hypothetical protein